MKPASEQDVLFRLRGAGAARRGIWLSRCSLLALSAALPMLQAGAAIAQQRIERRGDFTQPIRLDFREFNPELPPLTLPLHVEMSGRVLVSDRNPAIGIWRETSPLLPAGPFPAGRLEFGFSGGQIRNPDAGGILLSAQGSTAVGLTSPQDGGSISATINGATIEAYAAGAMINTSGGEGSHASNLPFSGGSAGPIMLRLTGSSVSTAYTAIRAIADGGRGSWSKKGPAAANGGSGGSIGLLLQDSGIVTTGLGGIGINVVSRGGAGGQDWSGANGANIAGGAGGSGGDVNVDIRGNSLILTGGESGHGIFARSSGGNGGNGGYGQSGNAKTGSPGGVGGDSGTVAVSNYGLIVTAGAFAHGIDARSEGGRGGTGGGDSGFIYSRGGRGGSGGSQGAVSLQNAGGILTFGNGGVGMLAVGAGGGASGGGNADNGIVAIGGGGGSGGDAGLVRATNFGWIATAGSLAPAMSLQSIGGGGGHGGNASSIFAFASLSIGGNASGGGNGGDVTARNSGNLITAESLSRGIEAQSIGGGGGNGGIATSRAANAGDVRIGSTLGSFSFALAVGGQGGAGGSGGAVTVNNEDRGTITTAGSLSDAILAQSLGGSGGIGGSADAAAINVASGHSVSLSIAIGRAGGTGGDGGTVNVTNAGTLVTGGVNANGVLAQSIGGGGGAGGNASASIGAAGTGPLEWFQNPEQKTLYSLKADVAVGGTGGRGGSGGPVTVINSGRILTQGDDAFGVAAQSIGGGGGVAGNSLGLSGGTGTLSLQVLVGGTGGSGNHGGKVAVRNHDAIETQGARAPAIMAQSVGGGGGIGGNASSVSSTLYQSILEGIGAVNDGISLYRAIENNTWKAWEKTISFSGTATVGGSGGSGGDGGRVDVENSGRITTRNAGSPGIFAQSIGGGGGTGGAASATGDETTAATVLGMLSQGANLAQGILQAFRFFSVSIEANINVGGSGGAAGHGSGVRVSNAGNISSEGASSPGIFAQSIGGGGGQAGYIGEDPAGQNEDEAKGQGLSGPKIAAIQKILGITSLVPQAGGASTTISVGRSGGASGNGGEVSIVNNGRIETYGANSEAILAQSVGGGGGSANATKGDLGETTLNVGIDVGGKAGSSGDGGKIVVELERGRLSTTGAFSSGVVAQSIGGGGGKAGDVTFRRGVGSYFLSGVTFVGGSGASGRGGDVSVKADASIRTEGKQAHGIVAQSVGGGGGIIAMPVVTLDEDKRPTYSAPATGKLTLALGTKDGYGGNGGKVSVRVARDLQTIEANAFGILAQSIGAGGGLIGMPVLSDQAEASKVVLGGRQNAGGHGRDVDVHLSVGASLATSGRNAHGIVAQSIGGGGGVVGLTERAGAVTVESVTNGNSFGDAGNLSISVQGAISTSGTGAAGVLAQSIGAGGGMTGDAASVSYKGSIVSDAGFTSGGGEGGAIDIGVTGQIATTGVSAPAILAMSLGSGAVFSDQGILLKRPGAAVGNSGRRITIDLAFGAQVAASGANSPGIYAVSLGNSGAGAGGVYRGEPIAVNIGANAELRGGSGEFGAAISTHTTALTTITNGGTIATFGGPAIRTVNQALVENNGTIAGNVLLGAGSTFNNREAGRLHSGETLSIATLNNAGVLNPGGESPIGGASFTLVRTALDGSLQQTATGRYAVDLDYFDRKGDFLAVAAPSRFEGSVTPLPVRALRDIPLPIASFEGPSTHFGAVLKDSSPVFRYDLKRSDPRNIAIAMSATFAPEGLMLSEDQARKAADLQQHWDIQGPDTAASPAREGLSRVFGYLTRMQSAQAYRGALDELSNDATGVRGPAMANEARAFAERLNSCPAFVRDDASMREVDCVWGRSIATRIDRSGSIDDSGYGTRQLTLQVGGQKQIAPGWFLGGSLGYGAAHTTTSYGDVDIRSQGVTAGAVLKREIGPWLFSGSLLAGYDNADLKRDIVLGSYFARASGTSQAVQIGGKLRASYQLAIGNWYLKPMADLDLHFVKQYGYRERGAGIFDLATLDQSQVSATVSPALEIGSRFELAGLVARAYLNAGASFASGNGGQQKQRFAILGAGDGLPSFETETGTPRVYGNARAGIDLVTTSGWELRAEYGLRAANGYREHNAELRAALRF